MRTSNSSYYFVHLPHSRIDTTYVVLSGSPHNAVSICLVNHSILGGSYIHSTISRILDITQNSVNHPLLTTTKGTCDYTEVNYRAEFRISWNIQHLRDFGSGMCADQFYGFCNTFGHFGLIQLAVKFVHSSLGPYKIPAMAIHRTLAPLAGSTCLLHFETSTDTRRATVVSFLLQAYVPSGLHSLGHIVILTDLNLRQAQSGLHRGRFYSTGP